MDQEDDLARRRRLAKDAEDRAAAMELVAGIKDVMIRFVAATCPTFEPWEYARESARILRILVEELEAEAEREQADRRPQPPKD